MYFHILVTSNASRSTLARKTLGQQLHLYGNQSKTLLMYWRLFDVSRNEEVVGCQKC